MRVKRVGEVLQKRACQAWSGTEHENSAPTFERESPSVEVCNPQHGHQIENAINQQKDSKLNLGSNKHGSRPDFPKPFLQWAIRLALR